MINYNYESIRKQIIMDPQALEDKLIIFEDDLRNECHSYGWSRAQHKASQLYEETLVLKLENELLLKEVHLYKKEMISEIVWDLCDAVIYEMK